MTEAKNDAKVKATKSVPPTYSAWYNSEISLSHEPKPAFQVD